MAWWLWCFGMGLGTVWVAVVCAWQRGRERLPLSGPCHGASLYDLHPTLCLHHVLPDPQACGGSKLFTVPQRSTLTPSLPPYFLPLLWSLLSLCLGHMVSAHLFG